MGSLRAGTVVLVRFPFSDLSSSKLRPAVVVARAGPTDWVLSQITSKAYSDPLAIPLRADSFAEGSLHLDSFARPSKLFTANDSIIVREVGRLSDGAHREIADAIVRLVQGGK